MRMVKWLGGFSFRRLGLDAVEQSDHDVAIHLGRPTEDGGKEGGLDGLFIWEEVGHPGDLLDKNDQRPW